MIIYEFLHASINITSVNICSITINIAYQVFYKLQNFSSPYHLYKEIHILCRSSWHKIFVQYRHEWSVYTFHVALEYIFIYFQGSCLSFFLGGVFPKFCHYFQTYFPLNFHYMIVKKLYINYSLNSKNLQENFHILYQTKMN